MKEGRRVNSQRLTAGGQRIKVGRMLTVVCCLLAVVCTAQNAQVNFTTKTYPFVHNERNEIVNDKVLDSFFSKLYLQRTQRNQGSSKRRSHGKRTPTPQSRKPSRLTAIIR